MSSGRSLQSFAGWLADREPPSLSAERWAHLSMLFVALAEGQEDEISEHLRGSQFPTIAEAMQALLEHVRWSIAELQRTGDRDEANDMELLLHEISTFLRPM